MAEKIKTVGWEIIRSKAGVGKQDEDVRETVTGKPLPVIGRVQSVHGLQPKGRKTMQEAG